MSLTPSVLQEIGPVRSQKKLTPDEFEEFALHNPELFIEQEADGTIKFMSPVGGTSGNREAQLCADLILYERNHSGKAYGANTGFRLPDGSTKAPDGAYVSRDKLDRLSSEEQARFLRLVPDFVVEVLSPSDQLADVQTKMRDTWIANGVRLAWLVDVDGDKLWIYRADHSVELVTPLDRTITGEDVLPGFTFDLKHLS
jgi:Uma2 family endonuclease